MNKGTLDGQSQMNRAGINTSFIEMLTTPCYNVCTLIYSCLNTECCCSCTFENESELMQYMLLL